MYTACQQADKTLLAATTNDTKIYNVKISVVTDVKIL